MSSAGPDNRIGPGFLEEVDGVARFSIDANPGAPPAGQGHADAPAPSFPDGPVLLEPDGDVAPSPGSTWAPERVKTSPRSSQGGGLLALAGMAVILGSWLVLSLMAFVAGLFEHAFWLGIAGVLGVGCGAALLLWAALMEVRAYRSLREVERLRTLLASGGTDLEPARREAILWVRTVAHHVRDPALVLEHLARAATVTELRGILRSQVADGLHAEARAAGRRGAVEGATLVALCPHPAWDGVIAGARGLLILRRIAGLYGLRPGFAVTLVLVRRVAWTAAGASGVSLMSQTLADHALSTTPGLKHVVGAIPGTGVVAIRLMRLASVTAEACSPVTP